MRKKLTLSRETLKAITIGSEVEGGDNTQYLLSVCTPCSVAPCGGWDSDVVKVRAGDPIKKG